MAWERHGGELGVLRHAGKRVVRQMGNPFFLVACFCRYGVNKRDLTFLSLKFFPYLCLVPMPKPLHGEGGWSGGTYMWKGVYSTLCSLTHRNFATFWYSQEHGNGRCPVGMFYTSLHCTRALMHGEKCRRIYISAWASALLVQLYRAMRRPLCVGRATGTDSRAFFVYVLPWKTTAFPGSLKAQTH